MIHPLDRYSDLNIRIPKALQQLDSRLYPDDAVVATSGRDALIHRELFILLLSTGIRLGGGIRLPLVVLSVALTLTFVLGTYVLTWHLSGDQLAASISAILATGNFEAWGGVSLGFAPRQVLPRNFVVAVSPYLLTGLLRWRRSRWLWLVFAVLGFLANIHLIAAFHLTLIFLATLLLVSESFAAAVRQVLVCGAIALLFASPAALAFLPEASGNVVVYERTAAIIAERHWFEMSVSPSQVRHLAIVLIPYGAAAIGGLVCATHLPSPRQRDRWTVYLGSATIAFALPLLGIAINTVTLSLRVLSLLRVSRYYFFYCFAPASVLLSAWIRWSRRRIAWLASLCLVILLLLGVREVSYLIYSPVIDEVETSAMPWDWGSFKDMCNWARAGTPFDAVFLVPTDWSLFRVYAERSIVADWKAGINEYYQSVVDLYHSPNADTFRSLAERTGADYIVVKAGFDVTGLNVSYENAVYRVFSVPSVERQ